MDSLNSKEIESCLNKGDFILVENKGSSAALWKDDLRLIARKTDIKCTPLHGWCACAHCFKVFQTHSKVDTDGTNREC